MKNNNRNIISADDLSKLSSIQKITINTINYCNHYDNTLIEEIFSDFLELMWKYDENFKHSSDISFILNKEKNDLILNLFEKFDDYIYQENLNLI